MAYRISQPLAPTQFDNGDKKKPKKKKKTTESKTRTLRGMSVRQADKARSGSIDRTKTTTKTTIEKSPREKSSKLNKKIERAKKRGVNPEYIKKMAEEKKQRKIEREMSKSFRGHDFRMKMRKAAGRIKTAKSDRKKSRTDKSKCKATGTKKCPTMKGRFKK